VTVRFPWSPGKFLAHGDRREKCTTTSKYFGEIHSSWLCSLRLVPSEVRNDLWSGEEALGFGGRAQRGKEDIEAQI
jgi:hypothetical protein